MCSRKFIPFLLALLFCLILPIQSWAIPVSYNIFMGSEPGFQHSFYHDAATEWNGSGYYPFGDKLYDITGTLNGDLSDNVLTIQNSTLNALEHGGSSSGTLAFTGGSLTASGGFLSGTIDFTLTKPDTNTETGTFHFDAYDFPGTPNKFTDWSSLKIWGQNWVNGTTKPGLARGLDLGGTIIPEPTSLLLLGSGLVGLIGLRKKIK